MPKRCPKCRSELVYNGLYESSFDLYISCWVCPLDPKDCRIAELERKCARMEQESEINELAVEELEAGQRERAKRGVEIGCEGSIIDGISWLYRHMADLERHLEEARREIEARKRLNHDLDKEHVEVYAERDEARSQLRERGLEVVALRETLEECALQSDALMKDHPTHAPFDGASRSKMAEWLSSIHQEASKALSNTSVTTQQVRAEIERETLEKAGDCGWYNADDDGIWKSDCGLVDWCFNDGGPVENKMEFCCGCGKKLVVRAAILGEKEKA